LDSIDDMLDRLHREAQAEIDDDDDNSDVESVQPDASTSGVQRLKDLAARLSPGLEDQLP
ncbi:hypothetical protein HDU86_002191, partial [Geranomyces michiganensis]